MDGENFMENPYEQMDDLGGFPIIFGNTQYVFPKIIGPVVVSNYTPEHERMSPGKGLFQ